MKGSTVISATIHVGLAANSSYFNGLVVTLLSLAKAGRNNDFAVHIMDGGLKRREKRLLERRLRAANPNNFIRFYTLTPELFAGFRLDYGGSYMTYARILMGSVIAVDRLLYLDTDLLIGLDVRPLWETALGGNVAAAVPDPSISQVKEDFPLEEDCGEHRYFNAGVMLVDLKRWRQEEVEQRLLQMIAAAPERFTWWDQTAMNALLRGRVSLLEPKWNSFEREMDWLDKATCRIVHYVGRGKPWNCYRQSASFVVWREFFRRYVNGTWSLWSDPEFAVSHLQWVRHRLLRAVPPLRWLARRCLSAYAQVNRVVGTQTLQRFDALHSAGSELVPVNKKVVHGYVSKCWN